MPLAATIAIYITIFLYGIVIGSFLNVCIFRIPKKESIVPNSHCMDCGHRLRWYDLFPVFSYILLRGRCRYCGNKISAQYPIVEASNGILYLVVFKANGWNAESFLLCLMASALLVISVIDEKTFEIPVCCNIFIAAIGIVSCVIDYTHIFEHLIGCVCVSIPLYLLLILSKGRAIGGGDVKLMAAAGLVIGWKLNTLAFFTGCILGSFIHVIRMRVSNKEHMLAMGPYLAAGIYICALWGDLVIGWYLSRLGINYG